jgi:hypothetical protein
MGKNFKRKLAAILSDDVGGCHRHIDQDLLAMILSSATVSFQ